MKNCSHKLKLEKRTQRSAWLRQGKTCIIIHVLVVSRASIAKWTLQVQWNLHRVPCCSNQSCNPCMINPFCAEQIWTRKGREVSASFCPRDWTTWMKRFWNICITKSNLVTNEGKINCQQCQRDTTLWMKCDPTLLFTEGIWIGVKTVPHFDGVTFSFLARQVTLPKAKICNVSQWAVLSQNTAQRDRGMQECCRVRHTTEKGRSFQKKQGCQVAKEALCRSAILSYQRPAVWTKTISGKFYLFLLFYAKALESELLRENKNYSLWKQC